MQLLWAHINLEPTQNKSTSPQAHLKQSTVKKQKIYTSLIHSFTFLTWNGSDMHHIWRLVNGPVDTQTIRDDTL